MKYQATITVEYAVDPSAPKLTPAQMRRILTKRVHERLVGERGQQSLMSVESIQFDTPGANQSWKMEY